MDIMNMTYRRLLEDSFCRLAASGIADSRLDAWYLMEHAFGITRAQYLMICDQVISPEAAASGYHRYLRLIEQRASRVPLQHLTGSQEFMGLSFAVNEDVLIPRQDSELLVELILAEQPDTGIALLDMSTGSGCLAVSLHKLGGYTDVYASDLSAEALKVAGRNAARHNCRLTLLHGDLFEACQGLSFDVIVSNPPYIPTAVIRGLEPEVRVYEPAAALDGMEDGLHFYRRIAAEAGAYLNRPGYLYLEIGHDQGEAVSTLLVNNGYSGVEVRKDLADHDRVVKALLF